MSIIKQLYVWKQQRLAFSGLSSPTHPFSSSPSPSTSRSKHLHLKEFRWVSAHLSLSASPTQVCSPICQTHISIDFSCWHICKKKCFHVEQWMFTYLPDPYLYWLLMLAHLQMFAKSNCWDVNINVYILEDRNACLPSPYLYWLFMSTYL